MRRRRPGYSRIPCPGSEEAQAPAESEADAGYERARAVERRVEESSHPGSIGARMATRGEASPIPRPDPSDYPASVPIPDRWRIVDALGFTYPWYDPYNRNVLKGDKPVTGEWFFNTTIISDTVYENREVPTPVGNSTTENPGQIDIFGSNDQWLINQNLAMEFVWYKGDTVFRPPDYEFRFTPVINYNYVQIDEIGGINVKPLRNDTRRDDHVGIQAAFFDKHLRNVSDRYDFDSFRIGIQPFSSDFRGFLFQDNQLGIRLFGNRENNLFQYNLGWFRRLEKDTNSGLNDVGKSIRDDDVFLANVYWQDFPVKGFFSQVGVYYNRNREDEFYFDENGFIQRPASLGQERLRDYDAYYIGYNGDGHFGRVNLTVSAYAAFGEEDGSVFHEQESDIEAGFVAAEVSYDLDWIRPRISVLWGSGDDDPYDDKSQGFDAIFENPQFAGADTSYWIRQPVPLIGGGRVTLSNRNGILNSMRSSKEEGQSNFTNPGILLIGAGVDMDISPSLRVAANWNYLRFDTTEVLEVARNQADIDEEIGHDVSIVATYRPFMSQNIVIRASYARLFPGQGFKDLFPDEDSDYFLLNLLFQY
ncbi:MAG: hypothetical protein OES79_16685 [Planctomycetota bacterium]|nr:hypothetical protein [Planctomycetota bacterium]